MSAFLSDLSATLVDGLANSGRGIWRINDLFSYRSDILCMTICIEPGFLTDFASVPRAPLMYWLFGDTSHRSAVVHDWLYHHHEVCDEQKANKVLLEAMTAEGIPSWRRNGIYSGVYVGGESSWIEDGKGNGHNIINGKIV